MRVLITGITGFIGSALAEELRSVGHDVIGASRSPGASVVQWDPKRRWIDDADLGQLDAVVHLAGESIGGRWTDRKKEAILQSRVEGTETIAQFVARRDVPVLLSSSAIGYYGDRGAEVLTEEHPSGQGFLAEVCVAWEAAAQPAVDAGSRTVWMRTGLVLSTEGGSFPRMVLPFKLGLGGPIGSGDQWWSWITRRDVVRGMRYLLDHPVSGPVNLTSPDPVVNERFVEVLGDVMHRPSAIPAPAFALKALLGPEMASELLLASQRVEPQVLEEAGFGFEHPDVESGLRAVLSRTA